jgi:hypothetical protein
MTKCAINFVPSIVQLRSAIGASVAVRLEAEHADGTPFDLTPYTVTAPFTPNASPPPVSAWSVTVDQAAAVLSLTDEDTALLAPSGRSVVWRWVVWLDSASGDRIMFCHGDLGLLPP